MSAIQREIRRWRRVLDGNNRMSRRRRVQGGRGGLQDDECMAGMGARAYGRSCLEGSESTTALEERKTRWNRAGDDRASTAG